MILAFGSKQIGPFQYILHFANFIKEQFLVLTEELWNLDLDSDSSFTSQELAHFDREKLVELAFEKHQAKKKRSNFISFSQLIGLKESDEDKLLNEEDKHDQQDSKIKLKGQLFTTLNEKRMLISKIAQLDTLGLSESIIKRKEDN